MTITFKARKDLQAQFFRTVSVAAFTLFAGAIPSTGQERDVPKYVGSETCADCHVEATEAWKGSHHEKAWTSTTSQNVLGDFDDTVFEHKGINSRFYKDGETYMIESDGPDGKLTRYPVHSVVGIEPLQQYLLEVEEGKLQSFDVVWDVEEKRWYHLYPDQELFAGNGLHWTGPYKNWNARCAECHATDFDKNYSPDGQSYTSTQREIGVGCEACHGPGEAHLEWAAKLETSKEPWTGLTETGFTVDLMEGGEVLLQQCAGCHSRREPLDDGNPLPGTPFHDAYRLSTLREGSYHADGQILDEVYVYGSFLQSKMYAKGVTCSNCHEPHSAELRAEGNGVCTQCHSEAGNPKFLSLSQKKYDGPSHHFHEQGSEGAQCTSCHMIERTYMGIDGRRDHSFRIPRPDLSTETRAPNSCGDCHADKSARWAAEVIERWYPDSTHRGPHYSQTIAAARNDLPGNADALAGIAAYDALPAIVRATALEMLMPVATPDLAAQLEPLLQDPDPMVRANAVGVQRAAPVTERSARLVGMLADPVKTVRIAAAREFLDMRIARMPERMARDLSDARQEWQQTLIAKADFPETQIVMGGIGLVTRRMDAALQAFGDAVELDPQLTQAWIMIIRIHSALNNIDAAREAAERAVEANPEDVELNLLRAELL